MIGHNSWISFVEFLLDFPDIVSHSRGNEEANTCASQIWRVMTICVVLIEPLFGSGDLFVSPNQTHISREVLRAVEGMSDLWFVLDMPLDSNLTGIDL